MRFSESIGLGLILGAIHGVAQAAPITPNFTTGTVTSHTETTTTVTETIRQTDFQTGWSYTATGTNITFQGPPKLGTNYAMTAPGETFSSPKLILDQGNLGKRT